MDDTADQSLVDGNGSAADFSAVAGATYAANQDPFTAADNGTVNTDTPAGSGSATPTVAAPANGASVSSPSWLTSLLGTASSVATTAGQGYTTLAPIISGKPATSPAAAGQPAGANGTVTLAGTTFSITTLLLIGVAAVAAFWFWKRK